MKVEIYSPAEWMKFSEDAHLICFNENRPSYLNRIDFALMAVDEGVPLSYMTCRETDSESIYMNYGGAFPSAKDSLKSFKSYLEMLKVLSSKYQRASTLIENTNTVMLKFALKAGLIVTGIRTFKGSTLLELSIEWG